MNDKPVTTNEENVIYLNGPAIKDFFEEQIESKSEFGLFIANADDETLYQIGAVAYWDDRIWEVFSAVLRDAATYIYDKQKKGH